MGKTENFEEILLFFEAFYLMFLTNAKRLF